MYTPKTPGSNHLKELQQFVNDDLHEMNDIIKSLTYGKAELIYLLSDYLIGSGGKRLRPLLTLVCAKLCNYKGDDHVKLAAAVEFIHNATLLHDDVVDESDLRRGMPTANNKWGNKASILVGDFLLSQSFRLMVSVGSIKVLDILSNAAAVIAEGEVMQLSVTNNIEITEEEYIEIITAKTAELFASACELGAVVAGSGEQYEVNLRKFGINLGIAFQIIDDALDYSATEAEFGKKIGDDFREGKVTLPAIFAYKAATDLERDFWLRTLKELKQNDEDLKTAIDLIKKYGILKEINQYAARYIDLSREALLLFPESEAKNMLLDILDFTIDRNF